MFNSTAKVLVLALTLGVAACGGGSGEWRTSYDQLDPAATAGWRLADVQVSVPPTLTVSEANTYMPEADIVWRGDPAGDRRAQVASILRDGIGKGAAGLNGGRPVRLSATVTQFHALTPMARAMEGNVGVHDIRFTIAVTDARTGEALVPAQAIEADKAALVGNAAADADARGYTQRVEIVEHLSTVIRHWLGRGGADPRGSFSRLGR